MHDYKLMKEDNTTLLFNSCFVDDEDIEYAYEHRFNILYTETSCCDTFKLIKKLMDLGYTLQVIEKPNIWQGLKLASKLYAKFIHPDNSSNRRYNNDKSALSELLDRVKSQWDSVCKDIENFDQSDYDAKIKAAVYEPSYRELLSMRETYSNVLFYIMEELSKNNVSDEVI